MHDRISSKVAVALASIVALAAFACSSDPGPDLKSEKDPTSKGGNTPAKTAGDPTKSDAPASDPSKAAPNEPLSDSAECGKKTTAEACGDCCDAKAPNAGEVAFNAFTACLCQAPGACKTECAESYCGGAAGKDKEPTAACITCLDTNKNGETCDDKAAAACDADANCKLVEACWTSSCEALADKEEQAGGGGGGAKLRSTRATRSAGVSVRAALSARPR